MRIGDRVRVVSVGSAFRGRDGVIASRSAHGNFGVVLDCNSVRMCFDRIELVPLFKVGERVRLTQATDGLDAGLLGDIVTIFGEEQYGVHFVRGPGRTSTRTVHHGRLERVHIDDPIATTTRERELIPRETQCPHCESFNVEDGEYMDNGVGNQQISPAHCFDCGASQIGAREIGRPLTPAEEQTGWLEGEKPATTPEAVAQQHVEETPEQRWERWQKFFFPPEKIAVFVPPEPARPSPLYAVGDFVKFDPKRKTFMRDPKGPTPDTIFQVMGMKYVTSTAESPRGGKRQRRHWRYELCALGGKMRPEARAGNAWEGSLVRASKR